LRDPHDADGLRGWRVRRLEDATRTAGRHVVTWDGRDEGGNAVATGVYFGVVELPDDVRTRKIIVGG
jgi:hypothetical protein